jgi:hypothetical protein
MYHSIKSFRSPSLNLLVGHMKIEGQVTVIAEANIAAGEKRERQRWRGSRREGETLLMRVKLS